MLEYRPTLGEIMEYYQREDILSILYYQTTRWKAEIFDDLKALNPKNPEELGQLILENIARRTKGLGLNDIPSEYPTINVKTDRGGLIEQRYDWVTEDDPETWQEAFDRMKPVLDVLDTFGVYYQIQFSGHRSLHLRIPAEAFPRYFQEKPIADFQTIKRDKTGMGLIHNPIISAINRYLPSSGHTPFSLRMTYATHPKTGLVAFPLWRDELDIFQPNMASIHTVKVDKDWFSIPDDAPERMFDFICEVMNHTDKKKHKSWKARKPIFNPPVSASIVRAYRTK